MTSEVTEATTEEENVVNTFIQLYDNYLNNWSQGEIFFRPQNLPIEIKSVINNLTSKYLLKDKLITDWRSVEEMPESYEYQEIIYSIVNLIIRNTEFSYHFLPNGIKNFILEYKDPVFRKKLLKSIYFKTYKNIPKLNNLLQNKQTEVSTIFNNMTSDEQKYFESLYQSNEFIYIFSGVNISVLNNDDLVQFLKPNAGKDFPIRSWSIDLRVAMQFTSSQESGARKDEKKRVILKSGNPFRVIFITKREKLCYVSPSESWEAEVLFPYSKYKYEKHFWKEMIFYDPPYNVEKKKHLFLFVIIKTIKANIFRSINMNQFHKLTDNLYEEHLTQSKYLENKNEYDEEKENDDNLIINNFNETNFNKTKKRRREGSHEDSLVSYSKSKKIGLSQIVAEGIKKKKRNTIKKRNK